MIPDCPWRECRRFHGRANRDSRPGAPNEPTLGRIGRPTRRKVLISYATRLRRTEMRTFLVLPKRPKLPIHITPYDLEPGIVVALIIIASSPNHWATRQGDRQVCQLQFVATEGVHPMRMCQNCAAQGPHAPPVGRHLVQVTLAVIPGAQVLDNGPSGHDRICEAP